MKGSIPDADMKNVTLTVYYLEDASIFSMDNRSFQYKVKGGKAIAFDPEHPLVDAKERPIFLTPADMMKNLSNYDPASVVKAMCLSFISIFKGLGNLVKYAVNK